ncbi:hypothetical protein N7499_008529 [Penicillium canescens]|uniref:FAM192A/Fyv6 N-terminal domain-containing protein n=1 Tax=Penicillium canescens TaxID=5083 RepID=A0AAD6HZ69_PENCN|nr:uncharacterized protein N7446_013565 [Penicillium canescens]KAJ5985193.1 hypothetical protein N7522_012389 [Penicillium canescens]KAJ6023205.1 hypothetical protein N7460_013600 [Penicillium canescens]KAJ6025527.1 hypothetical protein N7444_013206 [Penicillium canescens]KAJ6042499.1 hypothetical protein N7446_013565 [Penicillium canescens]KAJ6076548.1 hypothetical protein N7499_008529 [Penicillium canescens]
MSSGFVSAGTNEQPIERDDEWLKAQQELEEERRRKAEIGKQDDGKSLFEVLERNKMAKQEAFEEKARLKNQFRSLDEDEVEFLDSVLESTRAQEAAVKRDTADQLEVFRRQREEAEKALLGPTSSDVTPAEEEEWTAPARKRRRDKQKDLLIPGKKRKASLTENSAKSSSQEQESQKPGADSGSKPKQPEQQKSKPSQVAASTNPKTATNSEQSQPQTKPPAKPAPVSLGLAGYSSDSE